MCSLSSFGGPEAHYGVFDHRLVKNKGYLEEDTLLELIGVFMLVPGPSSTQTIMAIGYIVGGKILALMTFIVWALPAMIIMTLFGIFFSTTQGPWIVSIQRILPLLALGFIAYAGYVLSRRTIKNEESMILFLAMLILGYFLLPLTVWMTPILLIVGGGWMVLRHGDFKTNATIKIHPPWIYLFMLIFLALFSEIIIPRFQVPILTLFTSFYRYGYSVIGGGQIVIPLMIQDLVNQQAQISLEVFLSGYAIDQAIPGPLFSFASFVGAQIFLGQPIAFLAGIGSGFVIFLPGMLFVYFFFPVYQKLRQIPWLKVMLKGISITAASLVVLTAFRQIISLPLNGFHLGLILLTFTLLLSKKIPAPLIVILVLGLGLML